jgi:uncharacterized damage-inducible protein DinB
VSEPRRIADQLRRSVSGVAWHGPSLLEILGDVTADEAHARPVESVHSIAEIVAHVSAWMWAAHRGLDGDVVSLQGDADWPTPGEWGVTTAAMRETAMHLAARVEALADDELKVKVKSTDAEYSRYFLLHGVIQHNLYHAGQLALLKKASRS